MSASNEYLPDSAESVNGSEHKKAFKLTPVEDENLASLAPRLRHAARTSKEISLGAKVLFDHLTDLSFMRSVSPGMGIVTMSKPKLASELKTSARSIARWRAELESGRFIWTKVFWKGGFELTNWFIRGMANAQAEFWNQGADPSYGPAKTRTRRNSARGNHGQFVRAVITPPESTEMPAKSHVNGHTRPVTTDTDDHRLRTPVSRVTGQPCPLPTDTGVRSHGTPVSVATGQIRPGPRDTDDPAHGTEVAQLRSLETVMEQGEVLKRLSNRAKAATDERAKAARDLENSFLELCLEVFGGKEMKQGGPDGKGNGGLWRILYRQNAQKAFTVVRETRAVKLENPQVLKTNWAAYAMDLWKHGRVGA